MFANVSFFKLCMLTFCFIVQLVDLMRDRPDIAIVFDALIKLAAAASLGEESVPSHRQIDVSISAAFSINVSLIDNPVVSGALETTSNSSLVPPAASSSLLPVATFLYFLRVYQVSSLINLFVKSISYSFYALYFNYFP